MASTPGGQGLEILLEAVVAGDPVRLHQHVDRALRLGPGTVDGAAVQDVDRRGAEGHRPRDRHVVDDRTVEVAHPVDLHGRKDGRQRGRGEDRVHQRPAREPHLPHTEHVGGHALEPHRQVLERLRVEQPLEQAPELVVVVDRLAPAEHGQGVGQDPFRQDPLLVEAPPELLETGQAAEGRVLRVGHAVQRTDRRAEHQLRVDVVLDERPQHADLHGAVVPAPGQHRSDEAVAPVQEVTQPSHRRPRLPVPPRRSAEAPMD